MNTRIYPSTAQMAEPRTIVHFKVTSWLSQIGCSLENAKAILNLIAVHHIENFCFEPCKGCFCLIKILDNRWDKLSESCTKKANQERKRNVSGDEKFPQ